MAKKNNTCKISQEKWERIKDLSKMGMWDLLAHIGRQERIWKLKCAK